jgi:hypothetical protein
MKGIFSQIRGYFDKTYSGRYLACLLGELFRQGPKELGVVLTAFGLKYSHKKFDRINADGWRFPATNQTRVADIAILDGHGKPRVLVEIKDADAGKKENEAQVDDYLEYIKQNKGVEFLFLSRYAPHNNHEGRKLRRAGKNVYQKRFKDIHDALNGRRHPFSQMLKEYLEEINVASHDERPDLQTFALVSRQMMGKGRQNFAEKSVPDFFDIVFADLRSIGEWIQAYNAKLFRQSFRRRLYVEPWHDINRLQKDLESRDSRGNESKKAQVLKSTHYIVEYCYGGTCYFYLRGVLTYKATKVYLSLGYYWRDDGQKQNSGVYAALEWAPWKQNEGQDMQSKYVPLRKFPHQEKLEGEIRKILTSIKNAALKKCPPKEKQILRQFRIP